jgi:outer membrane receptor for ferric coprogen and ferric-rhodotorulic acid
MNSPTPSIAAVLLLLALACATSTPTHAATAPAPSAAPGAARPAAGQDEPVTLTPFEVTAASDVGYESSTAMSGTRTNESLANLPNSISVLNSEFMADLGITDFFQAMEFAVGAENVYNDNMQVGAAIGARSGNRINFRGLPSGRQLKDGFPTYAPVDTYNLERMEISRGAGGISYGDTDATGTINTGSKRARFRDSYDVQARYDDRGSQRLTADLNRVLVDKTLALRLNLINSDLEGWHENTARNMRGWAGAVRYQPFKHGNTVIDATHESGRLLSFISHTALVDLTTAYVRGSGTNAQDADPVRAGTQANGVGMLRLSGNSTLASTTQMFIRGSLYNLATPGTTAAFPAYRVSTLIQGAGATNATDPQNPNRLPFLPTQNPQFPLEQDWAGPDTRVRYVNHSTNLSLQHSFSRDTRVWLAYNRQKEFTDQSLTRNANIWNANARGIFIDVNRTLPDPAFPNDPTRTVPNPNFEQLFIPGSIQRRYEDRDMESVRLMGLQDLSFWHTSHRFILSANHRAEINRIKGMQWAFTKEEIARRGSTGAAARLANNVVAPWYYFKDGNGENLRLPRLPGIVDYFTNSLEYFDQSLATAVFQHLGSFFQQRLRTSLGLSRDHWKQALNLPTQLIDVFQETHFVDAAGKPLPDDAGKIPTRPNADTWRTNRTAGAVFNLTPWLAVTASYQESAMFTDNVGTDLYGNARQPTSGSGSDLGLRFNLLGGRVNANLIRYDNTAENYATNISAALQSEVNDAFNTGRTTPSPDLILGNSDSNNRTTQGWELELTANPIRNWTTRLALATTQDYRSTSVPQFRAKVEAAKRYLASLGKSATEIDTALSGSDIYLEGQNDENRQPRRYRGSFVSRYDFRSGPLQGFSVGGSVRWSRGARRNPGGLFITGVLVVPERQNADECVFSPFFKYSRKFGRVNWAAQLNIDNVFNNVTNQGTTARYPRYTEPRLITLTNFFRF